MPLLKSISVVLISAVLLAGCGSKARTAEEIRRDYALMLLDGFSVKYFDIRASRADPNTYKLYDLTLKDGDTMYHADEAWILVDEETRTVSLQLKGVVGADALTGQLMTFDDMSSGPIKLGRALKK